MKIVQLLSGIELPLNNAERAFVEKYDATININRLNEHELWLAQNLVRRGVYSISNDNVTLTKNLHDQKR